MKSYKELIVYQKAYGLALEIYKETASFPKEELYGIVSQMRRAVVSIPSNIAEGYSRGSRKEYIQFLRISYGSCAELETQIMLSGDLGFVSKGVKERLSTNVIEVIKLLTKLIQSLNPKP